MQSIVQVADQHAQTAKRGTEAGNGGAAVDGGQGVQSVDQS